MKLRDKIIWILLSSLFFFWPLITSCAQSAQKERTVYVVWDEFVHLSNDGANHVTNVQTYLKKCLSDKTDPETFYSVPTIRELTIAEDEFRRSAQTLHELRMRLEHPIPKGVMQAKK